MNSFFKSFFATLLALVVFMVLIFLVVGGLISTLSNSLEKQAFAVEPNSVLMLNINDPFPEQTYATIPFENPLAFSGATTKGLNDILLAIENAATDKNIKGIVVEMGYNQNPYASLQEVRNALLDFQNSSGKFVISFGEIINQSSYYLGSVADEVYGHPAGVFEFKGLAAELMFIKGTLDKLGVKTQVFWAGEYKSATEPLRLDKMSNENREQVRSYIDGMYKQITNDIAASRKLSTDSIKSIANSLQAFSLPGAVNCGLLDGLFYEDQLQDALREKCGLEKDDELEMVGLKDYLSSIPSQKGNWDSQIAIVYADGSINDGTGEFGSIGSQSFAKVIADLRKDEEIRAVVLRVNSPGGSAIGSEVIWREIELLKAVKPVVVSMGDYAASGGYMIACHADKIVAQPNTLTGSIGVFFILPEISGFLENKLGVTRDTVLTGTHADFPSLSRGVNDVEATRLQELVDDTYLSFKQIVADGRGMDLMQVEELARGRVWLGSKALELGLVDTLGGLNDAIEIAAELAGLEDYRTSSYPKQELDVWEELIMDMANTKTSMPLTETLGELYEPYSKVRTYLENPVVRTEIPYTLTIK